ncbi:hypothetical protein IGI04_006760 [Brassica rapa subsp. trilocularis]|uniref:Uncharacterized protein n=1 Tax=Brassica rapa subsp. trilocularis TaxID=1813537 RepID=A0ABQ7NJ46_BRACM|nr:hypothetical protein IGI04_006760 [Brassica rapa subsp. trilocularis]
MNALTPLRKLKHDKGGRYSRLDHRRSIGAATKMTGEVAGCHGEESRSPRRISFILNDKSW